MCTALIAAIKSIYLSFSSAYHRSTSKVIRDLIIEKYPYLYKSLPKQYSKKFVAILIIIFDEYYVNVLFLHCLPQIKKKL